MSIKIGIIGGSGSPAITDSLECLEEITIETPYGAKECFVGNLAGTRIMFISRHGAGHIEPPHAVNHRANVMALKSAKCTHAISTCAVGSLDYKLAPGSFLLPDQFVDFSRAAVTFYEGGESGVGHVDMTEPFSAPLRSLLLKVAGDEGIDCVDGGTYFCMPGPAFETRAEIEVAKRLGGAIVGMTAAPEAKLMREAGIDYQAICLVVNYGAGIADKGPSHQQTLDMAKAMEPALMRMLKKAVPKL